jgi:hypothetical protein
VNNVPITNWASGDDAFQAERNANLAEYEVGCDGKMVVSLSADKSGKVTIKLQQTSPANAYLNKLAAAEDYLEGFIPVVVTQADTYRGDGVASAPGFILKPANYTRGTKQNNTEWTFIFPEIFFDLGDPAFAGMPTALAEALG